MSKSPKFTPNDVMFGRSMQDVIDFCLYHDFPGTNKWPANHPIWDCNIAKRLSPREAWHDSYMLNKAVYNMFWIVQKSIRDNKYPDFVEMHKNAVEDWGALLLHKVLARFTIAKIAPKVTALSKTLFLNDVLATGIDLSSGVYCPMAGFGGIVRGCEQWFNQRNQQVNVEAYDINENLCNWYGWQRRDVLAHNIETDKIVVVCPPFGTTTEQWKGTDSKFLLDMEDWCLLIKEKIKAPRYIFFGPNKLTKDAVNTRFKSGIAPNGLFKHKIQASCLPYHDKYSWPGFSEDDNRRLVEIKQKNPWIITDYR